MERIQRRKLSRGEIQGIELGILLEVQQFCEKHQLKFYLAGGTLLGAIRHHGFIPWDDDIDICMPRPDYEKFVKTFKTEKSFFIKSDLLGNWSAPFAKVLDLSTEVVSKYNEDESHLWIDIFPVDGLPEDIEEVRQIYKDCSFYRELYCTGNARLGEGKTAFRKYAKYILKPLIRLYGLKRLIRKIEQIAQSHSYETADYVGAVTWGLYGIGERMPKAEYEKCVMVEFEGHSLPAMSCWDSYLTGIYGDYMQLPPVEKRQTHDMTAFIINQCECTEKSHVDRKVICMNCGAQLEKEGGACPICGGHDYSVSLSISDSIGIHDRARIREKGNKINGQKKICRDIVTGADYSKQCGKYVEKIRDINRTDDKYTEIVRDYETGEIIHFCNEKLSAHTGHGSAKLKNSKKQI